MKAKPSNPLLFTLRRFFATPALIISFLGSAQAANQNRYWDGGTANIAATGNGASEGAPGNWSTAISNWDSGSGLAHVAWTNANNDLAVFAGTAGTVTLTTAVTANALTFNVTGYTVAGTSALTLAGGGAAITTSAAGAGATTTISAPIAGTPTGSLLTIASNGDMTNSGGGSAGKGLVLSGTNTFTANLKVTSGFLTPGADATLGAAANTITLDGGGLLASATNTVSRAVSIGVGGGTIRTWGSATFTLSGVQSGAGTLNKTDGGILVLTNTNTRTGPITVGAGTVSIAAAANLGTSAVSLSFPSAATGLTITGTAVTLANNISLGAVAGNISLVTPSSSSTVLNGTISGGGASTVWFLQGGAASTNTGAITLNGTNTLTGVIDVERGPLILGNAAAAGTASIKLNSNNNPNGALQLAGNFTITNNVSSTFAPAQRIGVATGLAAGISGIVSSTDGTMGIEKVGAGTLTLSGANTLAGQTIVTAGTLKLDYTTQSNSKLSDTAVLTLAGGTLDLAGTNASPHSEMVASTTVTGNATITRSGSTANSLILGTITPAGGTLNLIGNHLATTTTPTTNGLLPGFITVNGGLATKDGSDNIIAVSGFIDVVRLGGYIGPEAGSNVRIIEGGTTGDVTLAVAGTTDIGTLSNAGTLAPTIVALGSGNTLRLNDVGTIAAGGNGLTIHGGTLTAGGTANTDGLLDVTNTSAIATTISSALTNNGSGFLSLSKSGSGALVLSGTNTYSGNTTVNAGVLALAGGAALADAAVVTLNNNVGVSLRLDASETIGSLSGGALTTVNLQANALTIGDSFDASYPGTISGTGGSLSKAGSGILALTAANTYTGGTSVTAGSLVANVATTATTSLSTGPVSIATGSTLQINNTNVSGTTPVIGNVFTGAGLLKLNFTASTTARNTTLNNVTGFTGTIQLSNTGTNGDKWTVTGLGTVPAAVVVDGSSQLFISTTATTFTGGVTVQGTGNSENRGAIRIAATLGGNVTLAGDTTIGTEGGTFTGNLISGAAGTQTMTLGTTNSTGNSTFTGNIGGGTGTIAITKIAAGTVTLAGTNTYDGATTLTTGTLNLTGSANNSALTMAAATTLSGEGSIGSLTTLGTSNLIINPATEPTALSSTGALNLGGVMTVGFAGSPPTTGSFRVLNYTGADPSVGNFALVNSANYRTPLFTATAGAVDLSIGKSILVWAGPTGGNWDVKTSSNWKDATLAASQFYFNDAVTFDDTVGANQTVNLTVAIQPSSITFNNTTYSYTLANGAGLISGTTGITKNGTGTVTLGGATGQNFTGAIAVNAGILKMGSAAGFGLTSGITVASGAQVDINGQSPGTVATGGYTYHIAGTGGDGTGALVNTGASVASNAGVKNLNLTGDATVSSVATSRFDIGAANLAGFGTINGNGYTLTKTGAGQVDFRGDASATPINIVVNQGDIWAEDNNLAFGGLTGTVTVKSGGRVGTYGARTIATPIAIQTGGGLYNQGGATGTWTGPISLQTGTTIDTGTEVIIAGTATLAASGQLSKTSASQLSITGSLIGSGSTLDQAAGTIQIGGLTSTGTFSGFTTVNLAAGVLFRNRLSGASNTISSNFNFANNVSEVRQHSGLAGDSLTLTGTIGTNVANGILRSTFGKLILAAGSSSTVSMVAAQGAPATGRGTIEVQTGATLVSPYFNIGQDGGNSGIVNVAGGSVTVPAGGGGGTNAVRIGHWNSNIATNPSELNVSGGTFDASATNLLTAIGWDGPGIMTVGGGATPAVAKVWRIQADGNGDSPLYNDTITLLPNGTLEVGAGGTLGASANDYIILNGGTLSGTADSSWAARMDVPTGITSLANVNPGVTATQTGALTGTGTLTKVGAGNLVLTGNSFPGTLNVTAGTLFAGTTTWTAATLATAPGGILQPGLLATSGTSTVPTLAFAGGTAAFRTTATGGDKFVVSNTDSFSVSATTTLSVIPAGNLVANGDLVLVDYNGSLGGLGFAGLTLAPLANPHFAAHLVDDTTNTNVVVHIDAVDSILWKGTVDGTWNVNSTANWQTVSDSLSSKFYDFDAVKFTDDGASNTNLTLVGTIQPSSVTFDATVSYTLNGAPITGTGGLTKTNTGALTLLNNNTHVGEVVISGGSVIVGDGGTSGALGGAGNITVNLGASLAFNRSDAVTLTRSIVGTGGTLIKNGSNTLTVNSANNTCDITVNGGTLVARGGGFSTAFAAGKLITIHNATLDTAVHSIGSSVGGGGDVPMVALNNANWILNGEQYMKTLTMTSSTTTKVGVLDGIRTLAGSVYTIHPAATSSDIGSPLNLVNNLSLIVNDGTAANDLIISGIISNIGTLTKSGAGTVTVTGTNTYTGATTVNAGTLQIGNGSTTGTLGTAAVANNANLAFHRSDAIHVSNAISGTGTLIQNGTGTLTLSGVNTYTGATTVAAGVLAVTGSSIADTNSLVINGGKVEPTGIETVDKLFFDATQKAAGTWGSSLSAATNKDDVHFSGTGMVDVKTGPLGYTGWLAGFTFAPGADTTPTGDPDSDGLPNGVEMVLGGNPATADDSAKRPSSAVVTTDLGEGSTSYLKVTFRRSDLSVTGLVTSDVESDADLVPTWTKAVDGVAGVHIVVADNFYSATPGAEVDQVEVYIPRGANPNLFGRLKVVVP